LEHSESSRLPSRQEVAAKLQELIGGRCTREEAADWARQWVREDHLRVDDFGAWRVLKDLVAADLKTIDRPYLYQEADFRAWLEELRSTR
jgi:hypothetical protein